MTTRLKTLRTRHPALTTWTLLCVGGASFAVAVQALVTAS